MELVVRKNELLRELQLFQGIVERKNTIPILANVLIEAKGDEVRMLATDLEVALRSRCHASVGQRRVADAAGEEALRDPQSAAGNGRADRGGQEGREGSRRSVRLEDADAAARGLSDAARRQWQGTRNASAQRAEGDGRENPVRDHRRRHAVFSERREVRAAPDTLTLVATDGHRLALVEVAHKVGINEEMGVILPKKTLLELGKLLAEGEGDVLFEAARTTCSSMSAVAC